MAWRRSAARSVRLDAGVDERAFRAGLGDLGAAPFRRLDGFDPAPVIPEFRELDISVI
jgi:hypothetical protein